MWYIDQITGRVRFGLQSTYFYAPAIRRLSVTPVRASVSASVRASVRPLSKFGVCSITFERLHRFNSNLVC